jgi:hypothetical protein
MAMPTVSYTVTGVGTSPIYAVNNFGVPVNIGLGLTVSATATYTIQITFDDITADGYVASSGTWFTETGFGTATTSKYGLLTTPCRGVRLNVSASSGSVTMQVQQAGER